MEYKSIKIRNGVEMPILIQGLPLIMGLSKINKNMFHKIIDDTISSGIFGFDTSHEYGKSEEYLGYCIRKLEKQGISREKFFITTKIGNYQQMDGNIEESVDLSLKTMRVDYIDLMLLHWPLAERYIENWRKLECVYKKGKVRSIGLANAKVRHLEKMIQFNVDIIPHVIQTEIHPFNTCEELTDYCKLNKIAIQSCSSLCLMIDKVKYNPLLNQIASKYDKTVAQIMLRWLLQNGVAPVFRAFKNSHLKEFSSLFSFEISNDDVKIISSLNENYRFHPESLNCAGY